MKEATEENAPEDEFTALVKAASKFLDLEAVPDFDLMEADNVSESRKAYAISLLRLVSYLRSTPPTWKEAESQAKVALGYIRHAEGNKVVALNLGERKGDMDYANQIMEIRQKLDDASRKRAAVLARDAKKKSAT